MSEKIDFLLKNSNLPGPRGNLELLYKFSADAALKEIKECLSFNKPDLNNSPEEFVVMCGVAALCVNKKETIAADLDILELYANHGSWRIRESAAIGIQEAAGPENIDAIIKSLSVWAKKGTDYEKRAVVAALCEPKVLALKKTASKTLKLLEIITLQFENINSSLTDAQKALRKALAYGWSVAIVSDPETGKPLFEKIIKIKNKNIQWIIKENLKKARLSRIDKNWTEKLLKEIEIK